MTKPIIFIKYGGSVITNKEKEEEVIEKNIDFISSQIKDIYNLKKYSFVIGNGAGSFGHIQVKKYNLKNDIKSDFQKLGFSKVSSLVSKLNLKVVFSLINQNLPAISIKPSSIYLSKNNKKNKFFIDSILEFLKSDYLPVLYGDMVLDKEKGGTVLSTEQIFFQLIKTLKQKKTKVEKVVFCGKTPGVLDKNGQTISLITKKNYPKIKSVFFENSYVDVTGGMKTKVEIALKIARFGIPSCILDKENLKNCLLNKNFIGTKIL